MKTFGCNLRKSYKKPPRKALGFSVKPNVIPRHRKKQLPLGETAFQKLSKGSCENLINTVVSEDLWMPFAYK